MIHKTNSKTRSAEMDDRWLSMKEISEYLGARRKTIYRWIETKGMPGHRIGRS